MQRKKYTFNTKYHLLLITESERLAVFPLADFFKNENSRYMLILQEKYTYNTRITKKKSKSSVSQEKLGCFFLLCVFETQLGYNPTFKKKLLANFVNTFQGAKVRTRFELSFFEYTCKFVIMLPKFCSQSILHLENRSLSSRYRFRAYKL